MRMHPGRRGFTPHVPVKTKRLTDVTERSGFASRRTISALYCAERAGFTLIELLVVISIIGLITTVAVVALNNARMKSRDTKRVADVRQVQTGLEFYFVEQNEYPPAAAGGVTLGSASAAMLSNGGFTAQGGGTGTVHMGKVPAAPTPPVGNSYVYEAWIDVVGGNACTAAVQTCVTYSIEFTLEGAVSSLGAGAHTANPSGIN